LDQLGQEKIKTTKLFLFRREERAKEISLKNLSKIIHASVVEIRPSFTEVKAYGHEDPAKKLMQELYLLVEVHN
jgi:hypothetical protein